MSRMLATLLAALAAIPLQDKDKPDKPLPPSEEFVEIKWDVQKDDRFDFKWTYDESRKHIPGQGETTESTDKRDVVGELWLKQGENGQPPAIVLEIKKAQWAVATRDYEVTLSMAAGKKLDVQQKAKSGDPKASLAAKEGQKTQANLIAENMRKNSEGEYTLIFDTRRNNTGISLNNRPCKPGPSLFDKQFLHSPIPNSLIRQGQTWKEPIDTSLVPTGLMDAKDIDYKATQVTALVATFKGGFQLPIVKPPTVTNQNVTGNYSIGREFVWSRAGYLQTSKEEITFTKKVDATGKDAAFYKEDNTSTVKQQLTIKKRPPSTKPDEKKDGEKPAEEKKPEPKK
jgi:hypothetical protein